MALPIFLTMSVEVDMNITIKKQVNFFIVVLFGITICLQACDILNPFPIFTDCDEDDLCSFTKTVILNAPITEYKIEETWPDSIVYWDIIGAFLDLDSGEKKNDERADLYYFYSCGSMCFDNFIEFEDSISRRVGAKEPGYEDCYQDLVKYGKDRLGMSGKEGQYTCFFTDEGRISRVRVDENRTLGGEAEIELVITTWEPIIASDFQTD